ncbi:inorganic phosphate transporter [Confluentibacter flavum]|uniref:Phosphate transporter n=1 Tax=Confluentibacter flavum TaxID=1909700 RepID=A0A2N3HIB1_9FLAO|nr:inorganic phosphate transporter [Confluentibacter flavum]PKQ44691.1 phosphate:sodium symporter [Confluentibacter flavum]
MENLYIYMLVALGLLAVADLVVGVSNDAVNFLNSAIGSKAVPVKTIMIVASTGLILGAVFSSGMMEIAREGIMNPAMFNFNEIMIIFMAVMIADILLLDFFNSVGMPTSTTVSIVFDLLGASVAMALIKVYSLDGTFEDVFNYINTEKATQIIFGILLSVVIAFSVGSFVQYIARTLLSFRFQEHGNWVNVLMGGIAASAITYFIIIKGLKGVSFIDVTTLDFIKNNTFIILVGNLAFWMAFSALLIGLFKVNIYKFIILIGTFALALAFAGNDLVNFVGVPIAAWQSFEVWEASGVSATAFSMGSLASEVPTPTLLLVFSGIIMVVTLWLSKKSRYVTQTEINLSREGDAKERFEPNYLSRVIVRSAVALSSVYKFVLPNSIQEKINKRFEKENANISVKENTELPAFDLVRASINLIVSSILIAAATSMKLPLSTTYVTFMVAMGTSLADRAWNNETAVYRVAGVLNVIAGWFLTAIMAFVVAGLLAFIMYVGGPIAIGILLLIAVILIVRSSISFTKKMNSNKSSDRLQTSESSSIQGVIHESADNIANVVKRGNKIYSNAINGLALQDLSLLKKNGKQIAKLSSEVDELRDNIFYFIKNLDESSIAASNFYIHILAYLQDIVQSLEYISRVSYKHVNNNHKKLKFNQIKELREIDTRFDTFFNDTQDAFESRSFKQIGVIIGRKEEILGLVASKIQKQVGRTRSEETSPKNTTLYFSLLLETKDLLNATMNLLEEYHKSHDASVKPARLVSSSEEEE